MGMWKGMGCTGRWVRNAFTTPPYVPLFRQTLFLQVAQLVVGIVAGACYIFFMLLPFIQVSGQTIRKVWNGFGMEAQGISQMG